MSVRPIQAHIAGFLALALSISASAALAMPTAPLAPHRAVYDLSLKSRSSGSSITSVAGRMVHEFTGTPCDGYSVSMRWIAELGDTEGDINIDDIRFASFEGSEGESYSFTSVRRMNDAVIEEVKAHAAHDEPDGAGEVKLSMPTDEAFELPPKTAFPTEHLRTIIERAKAGDRIAEMSVYDVSGDGKKIYQTLAVIGAEHMGQDLDGTVAKDIREGFADLRYWRVTISYFEGDTAGDETPTFSQSFNLFENGVAVDLVLDYGDIVISGDLKNLELLNGDDCTPDVGH